MPAHGSPSRTPPTSRTRAILRTVRTGRTYDDIGREFGVTGRCISGIAAHWGLPPRIPLPRLTIQCEYCGKEVVTTIHAPRKFCSKRCFYRNRRGAHRVRSPEAQARCIAALTRTCHNCGKEFLVKFPHMAQRFCGYKCSGEARARLKRPRLLAIQAALRTGRPQHEMAAQFGVSRQYVSALAARWGLARPRRRKRSSPRPRAR